VAEKLPILIVPGLRFIFTGKNHTRALLPLDMMERAFLQKKTGWREFTRWNRMKWHNWKVFEKAY
jgi:hypothetical protein